MWYEMFMRTRPMRTLHRLLVGNPLPTEAAPHQTIGKVVGLAVFASDALSSTAYATQEIMVILAVAGTAAFGYVFPISLVIALLLAIVAFSYEQTVHAYPSGGGAYIVARDNLGRFPAQTAGAALLTDYILTVAVSISSGVEQLISAFPTLAPYKVPLAIALVLFITLMNLRGVRESGTAFAIPTYFFVFMMLTTVVIGLIRYLTGSLHPLADPPHMIEVAEPLMVITPFLLLHAFSSGTAALTGIEAISNGITAFKEPRSRNAGITLIWMAVILTTLFVGISFLVGPIQAVPSETETVISQLARAIFGGRNLVYFLVISATTVILIMAANTAYADFPRLSALTAADGLLPRQLTYRGSRLVFSRGILTLAGAAIILITLFNASVTRLIPLYAIGVFLSFTLSQAGMARRWWKSSKLKPGEELRELGSVLHYDKYWPIKMSINSIGAAVTALVMAIFAITKFHDGAWLVLLVIPTLIIVFSGIHRHYQQLAGQLSLENYGQPPSMKRHRVLVTIGGIHRGSLAALEYARSLSEDVTAVHVSTDPAETEKVRQKWESWGGNTRLVVLESPYRDLLTPLEEYIHKLNQVRQANEKITIVVPQFIPSHWYHNFLHTNTAELLRAALLDEPGIVITDVPYQVD